MEQANSAEEALTILDQTGIEVDLMISDVVMEGLDDFELTNVVHTKHPHIKIQLMNDYFDQSESSTLCLAELKADILIKSFQPAELLERVNQLIQD